MVKDQEEQPDYSSMCSLSCVTDVLTKGHSLITFWITFRYLIHDFPGSKKFALRKGSMLTLTACSEKLRSHLYANHE